MRTFLVLTWLTLPLFFGAYHYGPGQQQVVLDKAGRDLSRARDLADKEDWVGAVVAYDEALALIPRDEVEKIWRVRLERNNARMFAGELPDAYLDLEAMLTEMDEAESVDPELLSETREAMANAQYYVTWTLRLEGVGKADWEPIVEGSRQNYKLLAETARAEGGSDELTKQQENLEAVIRLAEMDEKQLQAMPLPKQCKCNGNCSGKCCSKGKSKKKGNSGGKKKKDHRGASSGPPPDNAGS